MEQTIQILNLAPDGDPPRLEPIATVLLRSIAELRTLGRLLTKIEETFTCTAQMAGNQETVQRLQNIDLLGQSIAELSNFLEAIASSASADWLVCAGPAAKKVRLSDLATRLSAIGKASNLSNGHYAGEVEFFT